MSSSIWKEMAKLLGTPQPYVYQPLEKDNNQIRILHLEQNRNEYPLRCRIEHVNVDSADFTALSYVWGQPDLDFSIQVLTSWKESRFLPLTLNLWNALHDLRDSTQVAERSFWIDQISIDQKNDVERGHQVGMMGKIYSAAKRVIVYMGVREDGDNKGLDLIESTVRRKSLDWNMDINSAIMEELLAEKFLNSESQSDHRYDLHIDFQSEEYKAMWGILADKWSHRLWMVQERVLNPKTVMMRGQRVMDSNIVLCMCILLLLHCMRRTESLKHLKSDLLRAQFTVWKLRQNFYAAQPSASLTRLLIAFSNLEKSDPKDTFYALLGMASDAAAVNINPDYSKTTYQIFANSVVHILQNCKTLHLFSIYLPLKSRNPTLPSWVYDFTDRIHSFRDESETATTLSSRISSDDQNSILQIDGIYVSSIRNILGKFSTSFFLISRGIGDTMPDFPHHLELINRARQAIEVDNKDPDAIIYATMLANLYAFQSIAGNHHLLGQAFRVAIERVRPKTTKNGETSDTVDLGMENTMITPPFSPEDEVNIQELATNLVFHSGETGKSVCITSDGKLCLAPGDAEPGDLVTAFLGGSELYVLRSAGDGKFIYVGTTYIHGCMEGELFEDGTWQEKVQTFKLV
jgi:hypothetical protein